MCERWWLMGAREEAMSKKGLSVLRSRRLAATRKEFEKMGLEYEEREYGDGPWATEGSDSYPDYPYFGDWHFPDPDVKDEVSEVVCIERMHQGFLVKCCDEGLAFTDRMDAAEWLLGWLGFEDEIVESVLDILEGLWDADELYNILPDCVAGVDYDELGDTDYQKVLGVARAAQVYTEVRGLDAQRDQYQKLVVAVNKWRIDDPEQKRPPAPSKALDVAGWAWLYIKSGAERDFVRLVEAVKKWREESCAWEQPRDIGTCNEALEKLVAIDYQNEQEVLGAAQAFVEGPNGDYARLRDAVKKWRGMDEADLPFWGVARKEG